MMGFIFPFIAIMLNQNGLSATRISFCLMAYETCKFIMQIPSGVIADKFNRRNVLVISQLILIGGYILWLRMPYFLGYFLGYACWGLSSSLSMVANEAFLYDALKKLEKRNLYERVLGNSRALSSTGFLIASFSASYLIKIGFDFNDMIVGTIITTLLCIIVLSTIKPIRKTQETPEPENFLSYTQILKRGLRYSYKHTTVLKLISFLAFYGVISTTFDNYSEIFYNELAHNLTKVAIIFGVMEITCIIGDLSGKFFTVVPTKILMIACLLAACFNTVAFWLYQYPISLAIIMLDTMIIISTNITLSGKINDFIPSRTRATILSVKGFAQSFGALFTLFFFGRIVDHFHHYRIGFISLASLFATGSFVFLVLLWRDKHLRKREKVKNYLRLEEKYKQNLINVEKHDIILSKNN